jgi:hypothetical protein
MSNVDLSASIYLSPDANASWEWSDDGEVVEWVDGRTVVFRRELQRILQAIAHRGLPPLDGILFLITACRASWRKYPTELGSAASLLCFPPTRMRDRWIELSEQLDAISCLEPIHRDSTEARILLTRLASEPCRQHTTPEVAAAVCRLLEGTSTELFGLKGDRHKTERGEFPYEWLIDGLSRIDHKQLETIKRTGLDRLPFSPTLEDDPVHTIRSLIRDLEADTEFSGLARLTKYLMGGITLPRSLSEPDDIQVGGVSDIANRGPLDRLLLSELANDDDVLMTRVALNEALYLRRESPPQSPPTTRRIILDCGVRMWGVPRLFSTAVAMALSATADKNTQTELYRAVGDRLIPFNLKSREDLVSHLEKLSPEAHPGLAVERLDTLATNDDADFSTVLVTTPEVVQDREFGDHLSNIDEAIVVALVSRNGKFQLNQRTPYEWKKLAEQQLDLDQILAPNRSNQQLPIVTPAKDANLPAVYYASPFPFRLSHKFYFERTWDAYPTHKLNPVDPKLTSAAMVPGMPRDYASKHPCTPVFSLTTDGRLMYWDKRNHGAQQLSGEIPDGRLVWKRCHANGWSRLIIHQAPHLYYVRVHQSRTEEVLISQLPDKFHNSIDRVCEHGGKLFVISRRNVSVYDAESANFVQKLKLPETMRRRDQFDRFFISDRQVHALCYTGQNATLELVADDIEATGAFDCSFEDSPVILTYGGALVRPNGETIMSLASMQSIAPPVWLADISADGNHVVVSREKSINRASTNSWAIISVPRRSVTNYWGYRNYGTLAIGHCMKQLQIRARFLLIYRLLNGSIGIGVRGGDMLELSPDRLDSAETQIKSYRNCSVALRNALVFKPRHIETSSRVAIYQVDSRDGSRIQFDTRGLLHFKSSRESIPEFSMLITETGQVGFWCTTGIQGGPSFHVPSKHLDFEAEMGTIAHSSFEDPINPFIQHLRDFIRYFGEPSDASKMY